MRRIIINENQEKIVIYNALCENKSYTVDPNKVLVIKKYLDKTFKRASMSEIDANGLPNDIPIVGLLDGNGNVIKNMTDKQLFDYLQSKFSNIYTNNIQRDKFIAQIIKDWFYKKISDDGLLSTNLY